MLFYVKTKIKILTIYSGKNISMIKKTEHNFGKCQQFQNSYLYITNLITHNTHMHT